MNLSMNEAVLRVWSNQAAWDPEAFLQDHLPDEQAPWWRAGDVHAGRTRAHAGFNLKITATDSLDHLSDEIAAWVHQRRNVLKSLVAAGAKMEVDIGMNVGTDDHFTASILFTSERLQVLVDAGIDVKISAYPATTTRN